ncbi:hypothetical protein F7725_025819 [Dissostichus mawsoni]|uniref:Uncharacterized protein n=1 Tax=Dissostichus mawsoni TaxID=36200 RepID=A0A7J5X5B1_DISMA|nr:hypothetical protein F7725_025819 [Dissostichus mawsoni]
MTEASFRNSILSLMLADSLTTTSMETRRQMRRMMTMGTKIMAHIEIHSRSPGSVSCQRRRSHSDGIISWTEVGQLDASLALIQVPLTCRFGSGEHELSGAAALDLPVAGVDIDSVDGERLQAEDLQLALVHACSTKSNSFSAGSASVELLLLPAFGGERGGGRGGRGVGEKEAVATRVSRVCDTEKISAFTIRWVFLLIPHSHCCDPDGDLQLCGRKQEIRLMTGEELCNSIKLLLPPHQVIRLVSIGSDGRRPSDHQLGGGVRVCSHILRHGGR